MNTDTPRIPRPTAGDPPWVRYAVKLTMIREDPHFWLVLPRSGKGKSVKLSRADANREALKCGDVFGLKSHHPRTINFSVYIFRMSAGTLAKLADDFDAAQVLAAFKPLADAAAKLNNPTH